MVSRGVNTLKNPPHCQQNESVELVNDIGRPNSESAQIRDIELQPVQQIAKRARGRPKGSKNKPKKETSRRATVSKRTAKNKQAPTRSIVLTSPTES